MKKVLVTGGNGFLGKNVVNLLRKTGYDVSSCSRSEGIDILNYDKFKAFLMKSKPDITVHCAAHVGGIAYSKSHAVEVFEDNTLISLNVVKACNEAKIPTFINTMPSCTYPGHMNEYNEEDWWEGPIHESVIVYGLPRKMIWGACFAYCQRNPDFRPVHLIFPNMYGPNDHFEIVRSHALGAFVAKIVEAKRKDKETVDIWGTGKPIREWLYVEDGAESIVKTIQNLDKFEPNEIMNIGIAKGISIKDLAILIKDIVGWKGNFNYQTDKPDGAMFKTLVPEKMEEKLGWKPHTPLEEGIKKTVTWYEKNFPG